MATQNSDGGAITVDLASPNLPHVTQTSYFRHTACSVVIKGHMRLCGSSSSLSVSTVPLVVTQCRVLSNDTIEIVFHGNHFHAAFES